MKRLAIMIVVMVLATIACNNAEQTVDIGDGERSWHSLVLEQRTPETDAYEWKEISRFEADNLSIFYNVLGYVYIVHDNPPNHGLPGDQVLVLEFNDGTVKYFQVKERKLWMSLGT